MQALAPNYRVDHVSVEMDIPTTHGTSHYDLGTVDADEWTVMPNGSWDSSGSVPNGWSYSCKVDITAMVKAALSNQDAAEFVGNATYTVGHAELGGEAVSDETIQGVWGAASDNVFVVGDSGTVLNYNGADWNVMDAGVNNVNLKGVWGTDSSHVYAVGDGGTICYYNGSDWEDVGYGSRNLKAVWGSSATDVYAVGSSYTQGGSTRYTLLHTTNGGDGWTNMGSSMTGGRTMYGIWGYDDTHMYAVGQDGRILFGNGSSWATRTSNTSRTLYGVWGSSLTDIYAVGASGTIVHYNGSKWSGMTSNTEVNLYGVWGTGAGDVYAVGDGGTVLHYTAATGWTSTNICGVPLFGIWGTGADNLIAVGQSTGIASTIMQYDGTSWKVQSGVYQLYEWTGVAQGNTEPEADVTTFRLGDPGDDWSYAAWSVLTIYSSPDRAGAPDLPL